MMASSFMNAISLMAARASDFFGGLSDGLAGIPGMEGISGTFGNISSAVLRAGGAMNQAAYEMRQAGQASLDSAGAGFDSLSAPIESVQKIRDLLASIKEDRISLPDLLGVGDGEEGGGGGSKGKSATEKLDEELTAQEERIKEHFDRIKAITQGGLSDKLGAWGDYFGNLASLTGSNNQKLLGIAKSFAAAQALIDAWVAHNAVLRDPTLPWCL
jgi:hypothetical protein